MTLEEPGPGPAEARTDPRVDRTRATVLAAARQILIRDGWDAVTPVRVAEASGVGRTTIYRHWPDRSLLLYDVMAAEELTIRFTPRGDLRADLLERLDLFGRLLADRDLRRVITALVDRAEWDDSFHKIKARLVEDHVAFIRDLLQRGIAAGEIRADLDLDLASAKLLGPMAYKLLIEGAQPPADFAVRLVDELLDASRP